MSFKKNLMIDRISVYYVRRKFRKRTKVRYINKSYMPHSIVWTFPNLWLIFLNELLK